MERFYFSNLQKQILKGSAIILQQVCGVSGDERHSEQASVVM